MDITETLNQLSGSTLGVNLFEDEIDDVVFATNSFLTDPSFSGPQGPFWWILQMSMALGALFAIIMGANMAYKMMVRGDAIDPLRILRVLAVAAILSMWYPNPGMSPFGNFSILDTLAFIPNQIGGYTKALYDSEAQQVKETMVKVLPLVSKRDSMAVDASTLSGVAATIVNNPNKANAISSELGTEASVSTAKQVIKDDKKATFAGTIVALDKVIMFLSILLYRIGWWSTIYCQQILLGMLTIFGPIQWAFSLLPKWEGAWAKWITRYLTVHFYGAMLFFVGFYVLLLFDIVLSIQYEQLMALTTGVNGISAYVNESILTSGYLLVASCVALKCLNLVPDLAAWMIPEGDTAFSTRNFGEGVAAEMRSVSQSISRGLR
ncbi:MAG: hypothetical protein HXN41_06405 [Prevotella histicola]|uniref:hypothetical protein n=1 Tax=Prevotella histicola TaxID=470565 RepID=UPI001CB465A3|nr:hypothetical protein [Prevotella histicola]MBF1425373.1 hypothetical protein [Prevotella histicola]